MSMICEATDRGHKQLVGRSPRARRAAMDRDVSWSDANVSVGVTRQAVKNAPRYDPAAQLDRQQEQGIYEHYGPPGYWTTKAIRDGAAPPVK